MGADGSSIGKGGLVAGSWNFVVCSFKDEISPTRNEIKAYVGTTEPAIPAPNIGDTGHEIFYESPPKDIQIRRLLNKNGADPVNFFKEEIDEVRIYSRALSDSEVNNIFNLP